MAAVSPVTVSVSCSGPGASSPLPSKTKINITALTAANFTAETGLVATYVGAYANMTDGQVTEYSIGVESSGGGSPISTTANRGQKWIVTSENPAGRKFTHTIPAAPGLGEVVGTTVEADLSGTNWVAYKAAFEAVAKDPFGQSLVLVAAVLGGRRR